MAFIKGSWRDLRNTPVDTLVRWQEQRFLWLLMACAMGGLIILAHSFFQIYLYMAPCEQCVYIRFAMLVMVFVKPNFRPVFFFSITAEANYLLRQKQHEYPKNELQIAKILVENKIQNQLKLLKNTRQKSSKITAASTKYQSYLQLIHDIDDYDSLMGLEGGAAKAFFAAYFEEQNWQLRSPRTKIDPINATLDIGYTILFNYIEAFTRLFGFDPYIGVYHRLWFKRKSLICDLVEPFRCLIDRQVRKAFNTGQCKVDDFKLVKNEYMLRIEKNSDYTKMFYDVLIEYKTEIFKYMQKYYRCFMQRKSEPEYPMFLI